MFLGEEIDHEQSATTPIESDQFSNSIANFREKYPSHQPEYSDTNLHHETAKIKPSIETRPGLPKYLEAPKPHQTLITKHNFNQNFKRSNSPKPFSSHKRPSAVPNRPVRRRQPTKPVRDLAQSESNFEFSTDLPNTSTTPAPTKVTRKINYNYHPIIDFFKPDQIESRMDLNFGDSEWKPVTSMLLSTERTHFKK